MVIAPEGVGILRSHVRSEPLLVLGIKVDHRVGEAVNVASEVRV
jgi:hypothetical protein